MTEGKGEEERCRVPRPVLYVPIALAFIAFAVGVSIWIYKLDPDDDRSQPPEYSMAITGVAGLDPDDVASVDLRPTLSPVFNLTLRINNTRDKYEACIPVLSTAFVFYGDALLGKLTVQPFCAGAKGEDEGRATAWGQDVAVPRFLRDQLAGELGRGDAAVDVAMKMRSGCDGLLSCNETVLVCKAKFGGGPPCQMTQVPSGVIPT